MSMQFSMFREGRTKLKILNAIINFIVVNVMYHFLRLKIPSKVFFHHQAVFSNSIFSITKRVFWGMDKNITTMLNSLNELFDDR